MEFLYLTQPSKKWTFEQPKLKSWLESYCKGKVLNLFAGKTKLNVEEIRVDICNEFNPDYVFEAKDFLVKAVEENLRFDTIVLDPPYNFRKAKELYDGKYIGSYVKIKNLICKILNEGGRVISFGYDTVGMSKSRGFKKIAVCLVCHGGDTHDTLCLVEEFQNAVNV